SRADERTGELDEVLAEHALRPVRLQDAPVLSGAGEEALRHLGRNAARPGLLRQSRDEGIKVAAAGDGRDGQGGKAKREQAGEGGGAGHGNLRWRQADTNAPSGRG